MQCAGPLAFEPNISPGCTAQTNKALLRAFVGRSTAAFKWTAEHNPIFNTAIYSVLYVTVVLIHIGWSTYPWGHRVQDHCLLCVSDHNCISQYGRINACGEVRLMLSRAELLLVFAFGQRAGYMCLCYCANAKQRDSGTINSIAHNEVVS